MKKIITFLITATFLFVCGKAQAQTDGTLDTSFTIGTGFNDYVYTIAVQPDGKILVGGDFWEYNGTAQNRIVRLNPDGTLDTSFSIGTGVTLASSIFSSITTIALQSDGKILVGGRFTEYNGIAQNHIARLNSDGTLDTSFDIGTGFDVGTGLNIGSITTIAVQPDGKILVGGTFTAYNGTTQNRITRLNTDGTLDTSFTIGTGFNTGEYNHSVGPITLQPDGKILVGGVFTSYNGTTQNRITRLNSDGTLDTSFSIGTGFNNVVGAIVLQPDGKILVGGSFTEYDDTAQNRITRLNSDGTLDTSFTPTGTGFNDTIFTFSIQPNGKILVGGDFTTYNDANQKRIARLNTDGTLDTSFYIGPVIYNNIGFNNIVTKITLQPDGKILAVGIFTAYDAVPKNRIVRLYGYSQCPTGDLVLNSQAEINTFGVDYPNCMLITGNLIISGQDINDLSGLNNLTEINGSLIITDCPLLTNLDGLSNITSIGGVAVGGKFMDSENQMNNGGILQIENNLLLSDISGLVNIEPSTIAELIIVDNPNLSVCSLSNFCIYLSDEDNPRTISNNAGNCMSEQGILNTCSTYEISVSANPTAGGTVSGGGIYDYEDEVTVTATANAGFTFVNRTENETEVSTDSEYSFVVYSDRDLVANFVETSSVTNWNSENIALYPNPVKDTLYFEKEVQKATITDLTGKVLITQNNSSQIDMSAFQKGVYLITIEQESGVRETKKVIKY